MAREYDKDFKLNAVKLYLNSGMSLEKIAHDLGISRSNLGKWVTDYKRDGARSFPGKGHVVNEEVQALKRELQLVKQERDILKKAVAIFSVTPPKGTPS